MDANSVISGIECDLVCDRCIDIIHLFVVNVIWDGNDRLKVVIGPYRVKHVQSIIVVLSVMINQSSFDRTGHLLFVRHHDAILALCHTS